MSKNDILLMMGIAFVLITWGHIVTALNIPSQYESYFSIGGGILILAAIYNLYERKR